MDMLHCIGYGSSPRMRGALCRSRSPTPHKGIIPADAGSTYMSQNVENSYEDHPRGCGEHGTPEYAHIWDGGSSPRMRGALYDPITVGIDVGIIPADAGSTLDLLHSAALNEDHPRGCGEHVGDVTQQLPGTGIIPADAGSTAYLRRLHQNGGDHPRGCGEHC